MVRDNNPPVSGSLEGVLIEHCLFEIVLTDAASWRWDRFASSNSDYQSEATRTTNTVFTATGSTSSIDHSIGLPNTAPGASDWGGSSGLAVSSSYDADGATGVPGHDSTTSYITLNKSLVFGKRPGYNSELGQNPGVTTSLEYDMDGRKRDVSSPTRGPWEVSKSRAGRVRKFWRKRR